MGSTLRELPSASSPDLVLAESTKAELQHVWALHHPMWGPALKLEDYLNREKFLMAVPLAKNGGVTHWILTDKNGTPDDRPIYASCESLRKRALASRVGANGQVVIQDGIAHGIASVFTNPTYRGKGYASRMMADLGPKLKEWSEGRKEPKNANANANDEAAVVTLSLFSVLYSDIGKTFYAKNGWAAFDSTHLSFKPAAEGQPAPASSPAVKPLGYHDLAVLCDLDEKTLRKTMARRAESLESREQTCCAALMPDLDQFLWHLMREDFMTTHIFGKTPTIRGAQWGEPGKRVWAVWTRGYYGGLEKREGNTFHILRFAVEEDEATADEAYVAEAFREIIAVAQHEAREWLSFDIQMWNPSPLLRSAVAKSGLEYELVDREKESIASLMWYGEEPTEAVDWVANEKYAWC